MNTRKCSRCGKNFIVEEFALHECTITTVNVQEIGITGWFEGKIDENGDQVLIAHGLNGILYRLVKCEHDPPHPDTRPTVFDTNKTRQGLYRIQNRHL